MPEKSVYRVPYRGWDRMIFGALVSGIFLFLFAYAAKERSVSLFFSLVFAFFAFTLIRFFFEKITITDTNIVVTRYFRTKEIAWNDISDLEPKMTGFLLRDSSRDTQVFVSAEVVNLWDFIKTVVRRRGDLLHPTKTVFHESPLAAWLIGLAGLLFVCYSVAQIISNSVDLLERMVALLFGLGLVLLATFAPKRFSFEDDKLIVKTLAREYTIRVKDIDFGATSTSIVLNDRMLIIPKDGSLIHIRRLAEGMPAFMITFRIWLRYRSKKPHEKI